MKVRWKFKPNSLERLKDGDFIICQGAGTHTPRKVCNIKEGETMLFWDEIRWTGGKAYLDRGHEYPKDIVTCLTYGEAKAIQDKWAHTNYPPEFFDPNFHSVFYPL